MPSRSCSAELVNQMFEPCCSILSAIPLTISESKNPIAIFVVEGGNWHSPRTLAADAPIRPGFDVSLIRFSPIRVSSERIQSTTRAFSRFPPLSKATNHWSTAGTPQAFSIASSADNCGVFFPHQGPLSARLHYFPVGWRPAIGRARIHLLSSPESVHRRRRRHRHSRDSECQTVF